MPGERIRFAIIGLDHNHVYNHIKILLDAGAEFVSYYSGKPALVAEMAARYPDVPAARAMAEILEDQSIDLIAGSAMPADRAGISIAAMQHGKDVLTDKPAVINLEQLDQI